jgi:hypothetical protein
MNTTLFGSHASLKPRSYNPRPGLFFLFRHPQRPRSPCRPPEIDSATSLRASLTPSSDAKRRALLWSLRAFPGFHTSLREFQARPDFRKEKCKRASFDQLAFCVWMHRSGYAAQFFGMSLFGHNARRPVRCGKSRRVGFSGGSGRSQ